MTNNQLESLIRKIIAQQEEIWRLEEEDKKPMLRDGATHQMIESVENTLHVKFPPSYVHFLTLHDGCADFCSSFDLLGTREMLGQPYRLRSEEFRRSGQDYRDKTVTEGFVIGYANDTNTLVFFDRVGGPDMAGEFPVVVWAFGEVSVSKDFYRFLEFRSEVNDITIENLKILLAGGDIDQEK